jgi:putative ABC transport system substrate-binding protein
MRRRKFCELLASAAVFWPLAAQAQQPDGMRRIGVLHVGAADEPNIRARIAAFLQVLQQLGWTDGRNVRIDYRWGAGDADRLRRSAAELVGLKRSGRRCQRLSEPASTPFGSCASCGSTPPWR